MPELPEIETIARSLQPIVGQRIKSLEIINPVIIKCRDFAPREIREQVVFQVNRRGKFLIILTNSDKSLVVHLGMRGRL